MHNHTVAPLSTYTVDENSLFLKYYNIKSKNVQYTIYIHYKIFPHHSCGPGKHDVPPFVPSPKYKKNTFSRKMV